MSATATRQGEVLPVIFGADIGDYAFARLFHEATGVKSLLYSTYPRGTIDHSSILDVRLVDPGTFTDESRFIALLHKIAEENPNRRLLLFVNSDEGVQFAMHHRDELAADWLLPYSEASVVERANSKESMSHVFASLGLESPTGTKIDLSDPQSWTDSLDLVSFPIVVKPEDRAQLNLHWDKGLRKAIVQDSREQALQTFQTWHDQGIDTVLLAQQLIPGDDTTQWVINGYVDASGTVTAIGSGRVLLGLHQPEFIGNAAMILVEPNIPLIEDAARVVKQIGLRGFFSFDVKIDSNTGTAYWLDLNPRIGRGHYYLKVGGVDLAQAVLDDIAGVPTRQKQTHAGIYTVVPHQLAGRRYIRDGELRAKVRQVLRENGAVHPLKYKADNNWRRATYRLMNSANQAKQMLRHYPRPTGTGF